MKAKKKRGVEVPLKVKSFIDSVTGFPLENIGEPLSRFYWDYEKGDFNHWVDLMNHFDLYFEKYVKSRKDLQLEDNAFDADCIFSKEAVLQILRVTKIILENCLNKYCYSSYEHLSSLLSSTDPDIMTASLQTLAAFVKKPVQSNRAVRWHGDTVLNGRLFSLSQGWGGKEEGLGLLACAIENGCDDEAVRLGSTLHFEFYSGEGDNLEDDCLKSSGLKVIHMFDLHMRCETDLHLLKQLINQYNVPASLRFSLLTRLRFARAFPVLPARRQYLGIRLLAFTVLLQSNPNPEDLTAFFINEPEFVNELVMLLRCEDTVPEDIRILSILALAALAQDRPRQSSVLSAISAGGHRGILPSLMQKAVCSITGGTSYCSVSFVEALLYLVTVLVSSSSGCAALREAGLIPTLIPLLKDLHLKHMHLVSSAVHILEAFMDYSNPAGTLFRDLGGLDDAIDRLKLEVSHVEEGAVKQREELRFEKGKMISVEDGDGQQMAIQSEALIPFQQRLLLKALLRAIALGTYAPGNTVRFHGSEESSLPVCLCIIFKHAKEFGGGVFSLAASVMSDLIHKDPTCFSALDAVGLPAAFLDAVTSGVLPSSEAVSCIPHSLDALCLNNSGLQAVKERNALSCFVKIFTSKLYLRALANETPGSLASGLDELMRHAPSLRGPGVDTCIEILKRISVIGGCMETVSVALLESSSDAPVPMETDFETSNADLAGREDQLTVANCHAITPESSSANVETFLPEYINNTVRLLETILQNAETSRVFIEKQGIEALLQLYTLPSLPLSFGGSSAVDNMSLTFRAFSPQHSTAVSHAVCGVLSDHMTKTVEAISLLKNMKISDLEVERQNKLIRCFSATEYFLSLTSVLVRSTNTMMTELIGGESDVLSNLGKVHREVVWQISLVDDAKVDAKVEGDGGNSSAATAQVAGSREGDEDTGIFSVVRYVNPVSMHNASTSQWSMNPSLFHVMHTGEGLHRRSRREHGVTAEILSQMARFGRLARHTETAQDTEGYLNLTGVSQAQESTKRKSPGCISYEVMTRLASAARGFYVAIGKAMVVPSRRRDDVVSPSSIAKAAAATLAKLLYDNLSFDGNHSFYLTEFPTTVKCRYLGRVVEDILAVVFDNRRRTCNTLMVNNLYAHGALKQLLVTFEATSQLLWRVLQPSALPMESENEKLESEKSDDILEKNSWILETLLSYAKLMENLVTPTLLLTPSSMAQLLVQQSSADGSMPVPRDAEVFVRTLQAQVLEVIFPVWNHQMLPSCSPDFISSLAVILTRVYSGISDAKGHRNGSAATRFLGPPPDESSISMIVEMGFSRARAEEALRRVETNSVEMAMEWLFNHPEEPQEDDELARALALSLGSSGTPSDDAASKENEVSAVEEKLNILPVESLLGTCMILLQNTDAIAFPVIDLLVTLCMRNKGYDRSKVVSYLIGQLKEARVDQSDKDTSPLSTISHTLALFLSEDSTAREIAAENDLVSMALGILSTFNPCKTSEGQVLVPKWVTALLLVLDHMLQYKPKFHQEQTDGQGSANTVNNAADTGQNPLPDENKPDMEVENKERDANSFSAVLGKPTGYMTEEEQRRGMIVACNFLQMPLPATTVQAVLQLCARLTKTHTVAMQFLESGGLTAILNLPRQGLFPGFDSVAAAIIRHLLEDPQTLQQAMESEIRHTLMSTLQRHNGRVPPRMFLTAMAPVVSRDPTIFMQAAAAVCQVENLGERRNITLSKEKEKDKERDKEKDKEKDDKEKDKDRPKSSTLVGHGDAVPSVAPTTSDSSTKIHDVSSRSAKAHHKKIPHSFSQVIDQLLEVVLRFPPLGKDCNSGFATAMEVDELAAKEKGKEKVEEFVVLSNNLSETSADLAKVAFILKLMTEILLMYSSAVGVVLRRDSDSSQVRGPSQAGSEMIGNGGLFYHILHNLLPYLADKSAEKPSQDDWREKLSDKAAYFLMAVCVRSGEGRRRIVTEISRALSHAANFSEECTVKQLQPPNRKVRAFVDLINLILSAHSSSSHAQIPGFSTDMAKTMIDVGVVQSLTNILQVIDLDHPEAPKLVNALLKALEALTRAASSGDQVYGAGGNCQKKNSQIDIQPAVGGAPVTNGQNLDPGQEAHMSAQSGDQLVSDSAVIEAGMMERSALEERGSGNNMPNQMEHDLRLGVEEPHPESEGEELMHEASGDHSRLEENDAGEITFRVEHRIENTHDEDEEMDGDDDGEEEEEEDDEDEDDMEGAAGIPHLSPPDTDVEDHEDNGLGDEYGEDMVEDEDEEDDWQEGRVIEVRWIDGLTGLNHVQVLGHPGPSTLVDFPGDPFRGMNIDDIFSSFRRPAVIDRRRPVGYRAFQERPGGDRGVAFHHPLLTRPSSSTGVAPTTGVSNNSIWATGSISRDAEALLGGTFSHFYGPGLAEHTGDGLFGERGVGGPPQPLLDFPMDPMYLMGRRVGRTDGRLSSWTDDGQPQAGAHAAAMAQAIEEQFMCHLQTLIPIEEPPVGQISVNELGSEQANGHQPSVHMEGTVQDAVVRVNENGQQDMDAQRIEGDEHIGPDTDLPRNDSIPSVQEDTRRADVQIQAEMTGPVTRDVEANSQDSGSSAATVGESLRSLEVEIGSADGHDDTDRQAAPERLTTLEIACTADDSRQQVNTDVRTVYTDVDEEMINQQETVDHSVGVTVDGASEQPLLEAPERAGNLRPGEAVQTNGANSSASTIDPTFLEALPEDLRAEVLASQRTRAARAATAPPPPTEDIDPEFLAALPPDIQLEVLAQQRAQRFIQSQQVEGQPVDMDSASIIATFPAELREEVLLTSSEQVLAALPPSLLAEAQLLRERALNQYQVRSLFGGVHRIGNRRNTIVGTGGSSAVDRGVGNASIGHRSGALVSNSIRMKEVEGKPLVDTTALMALLQLLRLAQPLGKGLLQRLLLNLCAHTTTRATLVRLLLDMLRPEVERSFPNHSRGAQALSQRLYGCQWNVVYARSQLSEGVPPLVSRRVLEILTYLSRNHPLVAGLLLYLEPTVDGYGTFQESIKIKKEKGKAKIVDDTEFSESSEEKRIGESPLVLLLKLLNQPLYSRSSAHLEQVMGLLEVVTSNVESKLVSHESDAAKNSSKAPPDDRVAAGVVFPSTSLSIPTQGATDIEHNQQMGIETGGDAEVSHASAATGGSGNCENSEPSASGQRLDPSAILLGLPEPALRHLCTLLAREGLSDIAYNRVAEVLKKLAHIAPVHRRLFVSELADAARGLSNPAVSELINLGETEALMLSTGAMAGAAILRVLQCLSVLSSEGCLPEKDHDDLLERNQEESLTMIRDLNNALEPLWQGLSTCIGKIESRLGSTSTAGSSISVTAAVGTGVASPLPPETQRVLPFIEAFFVLCDKLRLVATSSLHVEPVTATACEIKEAASSSTSTSAEMLVSKPFFVNQKRSEGEMTFIRFADRHRRMLNSFVRQNPGLLEKSFSLLLKTPRLIDFDNKRAYFRSRVRQQHEQQHYSPLRISVRRAYVLEDSYNQLRMRTPEELKGRLTVQFQGEEGIDAGGLTREWYQVLSRVVFDKGALLFTTVGNESTFQPNPNSVYQTEHLSYFKFVGRVVGKALFDGQLLDVYFTRSFYKHILGVKVTYHDIEAVDPDYYKNLEWVLKNDVSNVDYLFFSVDADEEKHILYEKNEVTDIELIHGGRNIRVTEENKHEYVDLIAEHKLTTAIRPQINAFLEGFNELISRDLISIFHDKELELLISGLPEIDLDDLKASTEYSGYTAASPVVQWFWEVVWTFSKEDLARLLQFITGTSKVPLEGFRALQGISGPQRFQIHKAYGAPERLPSAHTCFNQLDLPEYSSKEQLQDRLMLAIHEASEGFGFG